MIVGSGRDPFWHHEKRLRVAQVPAPTRDPYQQNQVRRKPRLSNQVEALLRGGPRLASARDGDNERAHLFCPSFRSDLISQRSPKNRYACSYCEWSYEASRDRDGGNFGSVPVVVLVVVLIVAPVPSGIIFVSQAFHLLSTECPHTSPTVLSFSCCRATRHRVDSTSPCVWSTCPPAM
jgi:hypothetical protein